MLQDVCRLFFCIGYFVGEERAKQQGKDVIVLHNSMKIANGELRDIVHRPYRGSLAKCYTVSRCTYKYNFS